MFDITHIFKLYSCIPCISVHFKINFYQNVNSCYITDFVLINQLCSKLRGATEKNIARVILEKREYFTKGKL